MKKPEFKDLPGSVKEVLYREMELEYDSYESSFAEVVHSLLNEGYISPANKRIISNYYAQFSASDIHSKMCDIFNTKTAELEYLKKFMYECL